MKPATAGSDVVTGNYIQEAHPLKQGLKRKPINDMGVPPFHILNKKDIEKELSKIEKKFGMTPADFHKAWREGKVHGHEAMKLGCYYEFYKNEYE